LQKQFHHRGDTIKANAYKRWADERAEAILKYCYNEATGFFSDYNFHENRIIDRITAAGLFPLYFLDPELLKDKTEGVARVVEKHLLAPGGLLTTNITSGQQWDAPNGWAPLQWMAVCGLERCGKQALAREIAKRWIKLNAGVFERTGKLMEKYNVVDTKLEAGGGEYPGQDGFGWTNGVLLALMEKYEK
jgi:alpha,alpha-trehalase